MPVEGSRYEGNQTENQLCANRGSGRALRCGLLGGAWAALSMPVAAESEARGIGYAATGPLFDLPAGVSVASEEIRISISAVRLTYIFRSSRRQTVHFRFTMPAMPVDASPDAIGTAEGDSVAGLIADRQPINYLQLAVRIDNRLLAPIGHGRALLDGKDVTRPLLDAGVPLLYDLYSEAPWSKLAPDMRAMLEARGLLQLNAAQWSYQASFEWDGQLEPGETRLEVRYVPIPRYWSDITLNNFPEMAIGGSATRAYCIDEAVRRAFLSGRHPYDLYTVTHLAAPSARQRGPVGRYRLVVDKPHGSDLVAFCPIAARKTAPTHFEWTATNYIPGGETGVLFFSNPDAAAVREQE